MDKLFCLQGKAIVITGGAGILCSAIAKYLARQGARICIVDYDKSHTNELVKEIEAEGGFALPVCANVLDKKEMLQAFGCAVKGMGKVDVLINGAGGNKKEATTSDDLSFFDMPVEAIRWVFDLNLIGTIVPSQVFGRHIAERGEGVILNVSSMSAFTALTKVGVYSAAKAAVSNFTQWLAVHMCQNYSANIRVNAIAPGFFLTNQNRFLLTDEKTGELMPRGKTIIAHTPMGRFGDAQELCGTVHWLLSDASKFITGIVVPVDGGFNAFSGV